eukprot:TRINITY_DN860_c0_g2_i1.p1 TRINITY_DN860_c0_g2~~TRINITY_DN860_c0_g2_i1.p1  ORF type:complete len:907 (+),score=203.20 TRINITY_DN860_c0_g2_i1:330-3050(+)
MLRQASAKLDLKKKAVKSDAQEYKNPLLRYKSLLSSQKETSLYDAAKKIQSQRLQRVESETNDVETTTTPSNPIAIEVKEITSEKAGFKTLNELNKEIFDVGTPGREYRKGSRILLGINNTNLNGEVKTSRDDSSLASLERDYNNIKPSIEASGSGSSDGVESTTDLSEEGVASRKNSSSSSTHNVLLISVQHPADKSQSDKLLLSWNQKKALYESLTKTPRFGSDGNKKLRRSHSEPFYFSWAITYYNHGSSSNTIAYDSSLLNNEATTSVSEPNQPLTTSKTHMKIGASNALRACSSYHRVPTVFINDDGEVQVREDGEDDDDNDNDRLRGMNGKPAKGVSEATGFLAFDKKDEKQRSVSVDYTNGAITPRRFAATSLEGDKEEQTLQSIIADGKTVVISGTIDQLILHLYNPREVQQQEYIHNFLLTHRYIFGTSKAMFEKLRQHFLLVEDDAANQKIRRFRIIQILKRFIENRFYGFLSDKELRSSINEFIEQCQQSSGPEKDWATIIQKALTASELLEQQNNVPRALPSFSTNSILDFNPQEVAKQLTLIESKMWKNIVCPELYKCAWSKNIDDVAKNVVAITKRFNTVSYWVTTEIVSTTNSSQRLEMLRRFIDIGSFLLKLNNFNGAMQIYAALNMGATQRLKSTWKDLSEKYKKKLSEISTLMDSTHNYKNYREELRRVQPPFIPLQSVILGTLTQCEEIPSTIDDGRINFTKMNTVAKILNQVEATQNMSYNFPEVQLIKDYLTDIQPMSEDQLYRLAKESEEATLVRGTTKGRAASFYGTLGRRTMRDDLKKAMAMFDEESKEKEMAGDLESAIPAIAPIGLKRRGSMQKGLEQPQMQSAAAATSNKARSADTLEVRTKRKTRRGSIMERFKGSHDQQPTLSASLSSPPSSDTSQM